MSKYPENVTSFTPIELKLGIKSSLPNAKQAIALIYLLWKINPTQEECVYSVETADDLTMSDEMLDAIKSFLTQNGINFISETLSEKIKQNPLFTSQIEHLNVAFELIWKLSHFDFVVNMPFSAERSGGKRYAKKILFTANIDILDATIESNKNEYLYVIYNWLVGEDVAANQKKYEELLTRLLTCFSEDAYFQIRNNASNILFRNFEMYKTILSDSSAILDGEKSNNGPLRILCSSLKEGLNNYVVNAKEDGKNVAKRNGLISENELSAYCSRVENLLKASNRKIEEIDNGGGVSPDEDEKRKGLPRQIIYFGAPGTGKSFSLNKKSEEFDKQEISAGDKLPNEGAIKAEVRAALAQRGRKLTLLNAIGFKYADFWNVKNKKEIADFCNIEIERTDEVYVGAAARTLVENVLNKLTEPENYNEDFIKDLIKNEDDKYGEVDILKWANAIGYKYGSAEFLSKKTLDELKSEYNLSTSQKWWLYRGIQAAQINNEEQDEELDNGFVERVTFHPNYSYAQFVGTYKPVAKEPEKDGETESISYEYIPGPFMRIYKKALKNPKKDYLLIIEEINRANVAAVFGDIFQLLDRKNGESEFPVDASKDVRDYLLKNGIAECSKLKIPPNMYIWATMNSADQGVFPMDTAFKRRWEFEYIGINAKQDELVYDDKSPILVPIPSENGTEKTAKGLSYSLIEWNKLRMAINAKLSSIPSVNEDKLLGPFFIGREKLLNAINDPDDFVKTFQSKVIMYLYEDVVKISPTKLFKECGDHPKYSDICTIFNKKGEKIFGYTLDDIAKIDEQK